MISRIKQTVLNIMSHLTPSIYRDYIFRKHRKANFNNIEELKVETEPLLLKYLLKKNKVFLDIGAHEGLYIYKSKEIIPRENIYAFEPNINSYHRMKRMFKGYKIFNIALSDTNGTAPFKIPVLGQKQLPTRGTLKTAYKEQDESDQLIIQVKTQTLDSFVEDWSINNIGLIKIDVEGYEMAVIEGARNTIQSEKPVLIVELEQRHYEQPLEKAIESIKDKGYKCYYFDIENLKIRELENNVGSIQNLKYMKKQPSKYINNFIFLPKELYGHKELVGLNAQIKEDSDL